jgi:hypothetical protein
MQIQPVCFIDVIKMFTTKHSSLLFIFTFSAAPECESGQFSCATYKFNQTNCIPSQYKCDKEKDCIDGSDELNCSKSQLLLIINYRQDPK